MTNITLFKFTEADLRDLLDTLGDSEYPIAKSLAHGEVTELAVWVSGLASEFQELIDVKARMYLEEVEGREERGTR